MNATSNQEQLESTESQAAAWLSHRAHHGAPSLYAYVPVDDLQKMAEDHIRDMRLKALTSAEQDEGPSSPAARPTRRLPNLCTSYQPAIPKAQISQEHQNYYVTTSVGAETQVLLKSLTEYSLLSECQGQPADANALHTLVIQVVRILMDLALFSNRAAPILKEARDYIEQCIAEGKDLASARLIGFENRYRWPRSSLRQSILINAELIGAEASRIITPENLRAETNAMQAPSSYPEAGRNLALLAAVITMVGDAVPMLHTPTAIASIAIGANKLKDLYWKSTKRGAEVLQAQARDAQTTLAPFQMLLNNIVSMGDALPNHWSNDLSDASNRGTVKLLFDLCDKVSDLVVVLARWNVTEFAARIV